MITFDLYEWIYFVGEIVFHLRGGMGMCASRILCVHKLSPFNEISTRSVSQLSHEIKENLIILWKLCALKSLIIIKSNRTRNAGIWKIIQTLNVDRKMSLRIPIIYCDAWQFRHGSPAPHLIGADKMTRVTLIVT